MKQHLVVPALLIGMITFFWPPSSFADDVAHADVVIALDVSKSVSSEDFRQATAKLAEILALVPKIRFGIVTFADDARWVHAVAGTGATIGLDEALVELEREGALTVLYEGLFKASEDLADGFVLLVSDGRDEGSAILLEDVLQRYETERVRVIALGTGRSLDDRALRRLALLTGGAYLGRLEALESSEVAAYLEKATSVPESPEAVVVEAAVESPGESALQQELLAALVARIEILETNESQMRDELEAAKARLDNLPATDAIDLPVERSGDLVASVPPRPEPPAADDEIKPPPAENLGNLVDDAVRKGDFARSFEIPGTDISLRIGGRLKLDADHGQVDDSDRETDLRATASRFHLFAQMPTALGRTGGYLEADFAGGRARIRHAYAQLGPLLAGQTWSNFTHLEALPSTVSIDPPGAIVRRASQVRWTWRGQKRELALAVEDSEPALALADTARALRRSPDLTGHLRFIRPNFDIQVSGVLRLLEFEGATGDGDATGFGVSLSASRQIGEADRAVFGVLYGEGIGSYLVGFSGELVDAAATPDGSLRAVEAYGGHLGYEHRWGEKWRSTVMASYAGRERSGLLDGIRRAAAATFNVIWNPVAGVGVGAELLIGSEEDAFGIERDEERIFVAIQFGF